MSAITNFKSTINGKLIDLGDIASNQTTHTIQISSNDPPSQRYSINFKQKVAIKTSDITLSINGQMQLGSQSIGFGPRKSDIYVAASQVATANVGNTLSFSTDGINWYGLGTTVFDKNATGVCHNGKIWVAVANTTSGANTIAYSYDGKIWTGLGKGIFTNANCVIWNGKIFTAGGQGPSVGTGNTLAYSYDGINWTGLGATICAYTVKNIGWNGRTWVACGQSTSTTGQTAFSITGNTWTTSATSTTIFNTSCNNVAWNGYTWIGVGTGGNTIGYSTDGNVWTAVRSSTNYITSTGQAIAWNGKLWVAGGASATNNMAYTTDTLGQTGWIAMGSSVFSTATGTIKWTGKQFIALGYGGNTYAYSSNGLDWIGGTGVIDAAQGGSCIEYNNKAIHLVTAPQFMVHTGNNYSTDGQTWNITPSLSLITLNQAPAYTGKLWITTTSGSNLKNFSYDGINWFTSYLSGGIILSQIVYNGQLFVTITSTGTYYSYDCLCWKSASGGISSSRGFLYWNGTLFTAIQYNSTTFAYSYNGITWFTNTLPVTSYCIGYNGILWTTGIYYSYNGTNWFPTIIGGTYGTVNFIEWNGLLFVMGSNNGIIYTSYNGINWIQGTTYGGTTNSPTWTGLNWIMARGTVAPLYSYNGIVWTSSPNGANQIPTNSVRLGTTYNIKPIPYIQHPAIAVGSGQNTMAYSDDGITWQGLGTTIFTNEGYDVFWNGQIWVAAGYGGNSLAYSIDGLVWTGLGISVFTTAGSAVAHNGNLWVATGSGGNSLAYSKNGITWTGLGTSIFTNQGYGICYNGTVWLAGGSYTGATGNTMAYSLDGITWTGLGRPVFTTACYDVAMNGSYWFAVGQGGNTIAYTTTTNASTGWTGLGTGIFSTAGLGVCWNGQTFVAAGSGGNSLAYGNSVTNPTFAGVTNSTNLLSVGTGVCWNGVRFIATGIATGGNTLAYSNDGITWYPGTSANLTSTIFTVNANCVASNPTVGFPVFDSQIILDPYGPSGTSTLDFFTEGYQQQGYSQISIQVNVNNIV